MALHFVDSQGWYRDSDGQYIWLLPESTYIDFYLSRGYAVQDFALGDYYEYAGYLVYPAGISIGEYIRQNSAMLDQLSAKVKEHFGAIAPRTIDTRPTRPGPGQPADSTVDRTVVSRGTFSEYATQYEEAEELTEEAEVIETIASPFEKISDMLGFDWNEYANTIKIGTLVLVTGVVGLLVYKGVK